MAWGDCNNKRKTRREEKKNWIFQLHIFFSIISFRSLACLQWTDTATTQTDRDRPRRKKPNKKAWHEREFSQMVGGWLSADDWARALQLAMLIGENHARELTTERVSSRAQRRQWRENRVQSGWKICTEKQSQSLRAREWSCNLRN